MKITEDALEMAKASAKESEVPLWLVGEKGVITDVMIAPRRQDFDTSAGMLPSMMPAGVRRYGKVITKDDKYLEPGYNLAELDGVWKFIDEKGNELPIRVVKSEDEITCD
ncbi:MAG: hypothetical protein WBZ29_06055 [Methanocella sp.]